MTKLLKTFIIILILTLFSIFISYQNFKSKIIIKKNTIINIEKRETFNDLAKKLNLNSFFYKIYLNKNKPDFELQAGKYKIPANSTIKEAIKALNKPALVDEINLTFLE